MIDDSKKDKCLPPEGSLFSGGYALVINGPVKLQGKLAFLSKQDKYEWWECFDSRGDMMILQKEWLMPISIEDMNAGDDLDTFIYETRFGL